MPTIKLTDQLGAAVDVQPAPTSALLRYATALPALAMQNGDLTRAGGLTLDQPAISSFSTGLSFLDKLDMGNGLNLSFQAGAHGSFSLVRQAGDTDAPDGACYARLAFDASAGVSPGVTAGALSFGVQPGMRLEAASYRCYSLSAGVTLVDALRESIGGFLIPARASDLEAIPEKGVLTVSGAGSLKLSVEADLLALSNPLALATLPAPLPGISVSAGGTIQVGASYRLEGEFQIRAARLDGRRVQVGWYPKQTQQWTVQATASAGVSAVMGQTDLISMLVRAVSAAPKASSDELNRAGLSPDQTTAIMAAVQAAISRKLELALSVQLSALESGGAAFLYEIDLMGLTQASRDALDRALQGDFSALHYSGLPGISCVRSIWTQMHEKRISLDVNVLGIYNFASIATLVRTGTVLAEPATGALVLTDRITADRIRSAQVNYGADTSKLRRVLADSFLITVAYRGTQQAAGAPSLTSRHTFFDLTDITRRQDMLDRLRIGTALGLWDQQAAQLPADACDFGRTTLYARIDYNDAMAASLFHDATGEPYPLEFYENAGRTALQLLLPESDVRRQPATDDDLWRRMKDLGQPSFGQLFPSLPAPSLGAIAADYSTIVWWAQAMEGASLRLAKMQKFFLLHPGAPPDDSEFQALRNDLASHLAKVASSTHEEFGEPWGLVAMNEASGRRAPSSILIQAPHFLRAQDKVKSLSAG